MAKTHEHGEKDGDGDKKGDRAGEGGRDSDVRWKIFYFIPYSTMENLHRKI
jgi:hypothetical protein